MAVSSIPAPSIATLLAPLLLALPTASIATQPAATILPLLSPILRQRVQVFTSGSQEPWLRLLSYDTANAAKLKGIVQGGSLEPHPVSGEVEVDWEADSQVRFRRLDEETLQALVAIPDVQLGFQLVYCVGDKDGGGDGWRVAEVLAIDGASPFATFDGQQDVAAADQHHADLKAQKTAPPANRTSNTNGIASFEIPDDNDDDDDDGYWDRYDDRHDATPAAQTPAAKRSPAPRSLKTTGSNPALNSPAEDAYFAQYDSVQPAMDNHDPDEEQNLEAIGVPLGLDRGLANPPDPANRPHPPEAAETAGTWTLADALKKTSPRDDHANGAGLAHPRPASSASSSKGSDTVARLEVTAERQGHGEFGVKQHVSRSIRSLFLLSRAAGIDRAEFESMVRTELDVLGMIDDED